MVPRNLLNKITTLRDQHLKRIITHRCWMEKKSNLSINTVSQKNLIL